MRSSSAQEEGLFSVLEAPPGEHFALLSLPLSPNYNSDTVLWNQTLVRPVSPAPGTTETGNLEIGLAFWPLTQLLSPTNALWVPQISYTDTDYTHANEAAQSLVESIGLDNIGAIEIGNEPNLYGNVWATDAQT